ncbi:MAG: transposase, partial [Planctomycetes bacterium]|nr:transposase [Planctomycetota bacterium]
WIAANARWVLGIVLRRPGQTTFEVQKWRWIVERTFGWFGRYRRLSKDYEQPHEQRGVDLYRHDPSHVSVQLARQEHG